MTFTDRADAGWRLAEALEAYRGEDVVVLGLPRGGVPVAYQVACALDVPLYVIVVRKLGVPFQPEVAMGAIGEDGVRVLDSAMVARADVSEAEVAEVERREQEVLATRLRRYRRGRDRVDLHGRTAIVVDDGVATGSTAQPAARDWQIPAKPPLRTPDRAVRRDQSGSVAAGTGYRQHGDSGDQGGITRVAPLITPDRSATY